MSPARRWISMQRPIPFLPRYRHSRSIVVLRIGYEPRIVGTRRHRPDLTAVWGTASPALVSGWPASFLRRRGDDAPLRTWNRGKSFTCLLASWKFATS